MSCCIHTRVTVVLEIKEHRGSGSPQGQLKPPYHPSGGIWHRPQQQEPNVLDLSAWPPPKRLRVPTLCPRDHAGVRQTRAGGLLLETKREAAASGSFCPSGLKTEGGRAGSNAGGKGDESHSAAAEKWGNCPKMMRFREPNHCR